MYYKVKANNNPMYVCGKMINSRLTGKAIPCRELDSTIRPMYTVAYLESQISDVTEIHSVSLLTKLRKIFNG